LHLAALLCSFLSPLNIQKFILISLFHVFHRSVAFPSLAFMHSPPRCEIKFPLQIQDSIGAHVSEEDQSPNRGQRQPAESDIPSAYFHAETAAIPNLAQTADHGTSIADEGIADEGIADEGIVVEGSATSTLSSSCFEWVHENGREYANYGKNLYGLPIDEKEQDRLDIQHAKYLDILGGELYLAPIGPNPQDILDLGTGTGIWAIEVADASPSATVVGVDIAPIQPMWIPPNCRFEVADVEEWPYGEGKFNYIHAREFIQSIRNWQELVKQAHGSLKPGGWLELACEDIWPYCDDSSLPSNSALEATCELLRDASDEFGTSARAPFHYADYLRQQGFENVVEKVYKVPLGGWPRDERLKTVGQFHQVNFELGATAFGLRVFQAAFGWSGEQTAIQMALLMKDVHNKAFHTYSK
jgi:SAM-dependent methyltransferase